MKKMLLATVLLLTAVSFAQEKRSKTSDLSPEKRVEIQVSRMKIELDLNDNQTAEIRKIMTEQHQKAARKRTERAAKKDSLHKLDPAARQQLKKNREAQEQAHEAQMKKILTAAQFETWKQIKTDRKNKRKERMQKRTPREN
jgi:Spy/CpxP family protein refolding chaperone